MNDLPPGEHDPMPAPLFKPAPDAAPTHTFTVATALTQQALDKALKTLWDFPSAPWGCSQFAWFHTPARRSALLRSPGVKAERERAAWQEAGRSAWVESVRERLQSSLYAADNGYGWSWEAPGVFTVPGQSKVLQVRPAAGLWKPQESA